MNETPDDVDYERPALQRQPRGWLTPQVLYLTRSEHEQLKADNSKLLKREGVTVIDVAGLLKADEGKPSNIVCLPSSDMGGATSKRQAR